MKVEECLKLHIILAHMQVFSSAHDFWYSLK